MVVVVVDSSRSSRRSRASEGQFVVLYFLLGLFEFFFIFQWVYLINM